MFARCAPPPSPPERADGAAGRSRCPLSVSSPPPVRRAPEVSPAPPIPPPQRLRPHAAAASPSAPTARLRAARAPGRDGSRMAPGDVQDRAPEGRLLRSVSDRRQMGRSPLREGARAAFPSGARPRYRSRDRRHHGRPRGCLDDARLGGRLVSERHRRDERDRLRERSGQRLFTPAQLEPLRRGSPLRERAESLELQRRGTVRLCSGRRLHPVLAHQLRQRLPDGLEHVRRKLLAEQQQLGSGPRRASHEPAEHGPGRRRREFRHADHERRRRKGLRVLAAEHPRPGPGMDGGAVRRLRRRWRIGGDLQRR